MKWHLALNEILLTDLKLLEAVSLALCLLSVLR